MTASTHDATAGVPTSGRLARPDAVRKDCRHWIAAENRYCRSGDGVRHYIPGYRCPAHTPAALQGKPEPQPGPGWPSRKEAQ